MWDVYMSDKGFCFLFSLLQLFVLVQVHSLPLSHQSRVLTASKPDNFHTIRESIMGMADCWKCSCYSNPTLFTLPDLSLLFLHSPWSQVHIKWGLGPKDVGLILVLIQPVERRVDQSHVKPEDDASQDQSHLRVCQAELNIRQYKLKVMQNRYNRKMV